MQQQKQELDKRNKITIKVKNAKPKRQQTPKNPQYQKMEQKKMHNTTKKMQQKQKKIIKKIIKPPAKSKNATTEPNVTTKPKPETTKKIQKHFNTKSKQT